jgi:GT2 family glycosyltransferase
MRPEDLLRSDGRSPAWAAFDQDWYLCAYPKIRDELADRSRSGVLDFYLEHGQRLGHSPNMFFDEAWYLATYPELCGLVASGKFRSGFHHYCAVGHPDRSPHWLFDDVLYQTLNPDIVKALPGVLNRYDHYLQYGAKENRRAHILFDPDCYRTRVGDDAEADRHGLFAHFLRLIHSRGDAQTSIYFDADWYRYRYPAVDRAIREGSWLCALHHYACNSLPADFDPLCQFSERFYRDNNPDIQPALAAGTLRSGYQHFLFHGVFELRAPAPFVDLLAHRDARSGQHEAAGGAPRDAFAELLQSRRPRQPLAETAVDEQHGRALFELRARILSTRLGRTALDFTVNGPAEISVIVVARDKFTLTMAALTSLRMNHSGAIELILVDAGSVDETRHIARYLTGATILRFENNVGFVRGCNAALARASASAVLFMNNDVELAPSCLAAGLRRLRADDTIGAVGGKVIRTHGRLQEAGSIIWRDGRTSGYLRDAPATVPEADFVRDVDFCSGAFLLVRGAALRALGGFDEAFAPAYYEDTDLCVRLRQAGYRIVYDPAVQLTHYEYGSADSADAVVSLMEQNRKVFVRKHAAWLKHQYAAGAGVEVFARNAGVPRRRVLFIEDTVPLRGIGSGYVRANDIVRSMVATGWQVTVFPVNGCRFEVARVFADMPDTVEVIHDRTIENLPEFLQQRAGHYDVIWISRAHNLDKVKPALERNYADPNRVTVVLDTEAIFSLRGLAQAKLTGSAFDLDRALEREFANAWFCQRIVAVNEAEAETLRARLGLTDITVLGTMREPTPTPRSYEDRSGLLFVGAIHQPDSPNHDALRWFIDEVLPLLVPRLGAGARLTVAGYTGPCVSLDRWRRHPDVELLGEVSDLAPLYDRHRVFVAPTRYAAGTPYKVYEAAGHGLPVVASELLCNQLGWFDGTEILAADIGKPAAFAERIALLYSSRRLWHAVRSHATARLERENAPGRYGERLRDLLGHFPPPMQPTREPLRSPRIPQRPYPVAAE